HATTPAETRKPTEERELARRVHRGSSPPSLTSHDEDRVHGSGEAGAEGGGPCVRGSERDLGVPFDLPAFPGAALVGDFQRKLASEPDREIDQMDAEIDEDAASGEASLAAKVGAGRYAIVRSPKRPRHADKGPEPPGVDRSLQHYQVRAEAVV